MMDVNFPNYMEVIAKDNDRRVTVTRERLLSSIKRVSLVANELRRPFATKTRLANPADFKGKRVRVYASEVQALTMRALGARPSHEGWADVRAALIRGQLQGPIQQMTGRLLKGRQALLLVLGLRLGHPVPPPPVDTPGR